MHLCILFYSYMVIIWYLLSTEFLLLSVSDVYRGVEYAFLCRRCSAISWALLRTSSLLSLVWKTKSSFKWATSWQTHKMAVHPAKTQISLGICPVWSESLLPAWRNLGSSATHWAHREDSDQSGRIPRLIWVFAGRTCHFVGFVMRQLKSWIKYQNQIPSNE